MFKQSGNDIIRWGLLTEPPGSIEAGIRNSGDPYWIRLEMFGFKPPKRMLLWPRYYSTQRMADLVNLILEHNNDIYDMELVKRALASKPTGNMLMALPDWFVEFSVDEILHASARERMNATTNLIKWLTDIRADPAMFGLERPAEKIV